MLPDLSLLSIDAKADRKGKEARKGARAKPYSNPQEEQEQQRRLADRLLAKRPVVRTMERGTGIEKPELLFSNNEEHRRIFAVVCYTRSFDGILVEMMRNPKKQPFDLWQSLPRTKTAKWSRIEAGLAFFHPDDYLEYDPGPARVDAVAECEAMFVNYDDTDDGKRKEAWLYNMGEVYDSLSSGEDIDVDPDDYFQLQELMNESLSMMLRAFKKTFSPWKQWAPVEAGGQLVAAKASFMPKGCGAQSVLFSGNRVPVPDPARLATRAISTSYSIATAIEFTENKEKPPGALMVLALDMDVEVVNVSAVTSAADDDFTCFQEECEIIIEPGVSYVRLPNLSEYPLHKQEYEKAWAGYEKDKSGPVVFFRVMAPRRLRNV